MRTTFGESASTCIRDSIVLSSTPWGTSFTLDTFPRGCQPPLANTEREPSSKTPKEMALDMCMISEETVNFRQNTAVRPDQERKPQPGLNLGSALYLHGSVDTSVDHDATSLILS
jgi:hypothetical protein